MVASTVQVQKYQFKFVETDPHYLIFQKGIFGSHLFSYQEKKQMITKELGKQSQNLTHPDQLMNYSEVGQM